MKTFFTAVAAILVAGTAFAQQDTTIIENADTVRVGTFIIIKKNKTPERTVTVERPKKFSRLKTNWWIVDLGFANVDDKTNYSSAEAQNFLRTVRPGDKPITRDDLKLRASKSSNVNVWVLMQRLSLAKGYLNLKYGLGLEMFNLRYQSNITYNNNPAYIFRDSISSFSKNKLYAGYLSVPFMVNVNTSPGRKGLSFSAGVSAGYRVGSRNKQVSNERGKEKIKGDLGLEQFRLAYIGELGLGPVKLFGSYSLTPLHENGLEQYPYSVGIRLSSF